MNKTELLSLLNKYNIDVSKWKKAPDKLLYELNNGESILSIKNNTLIRTVKIAVLFCCMTDKKFISEIRVNKNKTEYLLTEKLVCKESFKKAFFRGLREELHLKRDDYGKVIFLGSYKETKNSNSYPGIEANYNYKAFFTNIRILPDFNSFEKNLNFKIISLDEFTEPNIYFINEVKKILIS